MNILSESLTKNNMKVKKQKKKPDGTESEIKSETYTKTSVRKLVDMVWTCLS